MMGSVLHPAYRIVLLMLIAVSMLLLVSDKWKAGNWKSSIYSDGKGYYGYLPAIFIYQDLTYSFYGDIARKYYNNNTGEADFLNEVNGKKVNKYFGGTAFLMLPFFLIAWLISAIAGTETDGFSVFFQCGIGIAALFYYIAGLWLLRKTLKTYALPEWICILCLLSIGIGTNLYYYVIVEPSMSHVYSFFAVSLFVYFVRKNFIGISRRNLLFAGLALGLIVFIRPTNGIIVLAIPFLSDGWKNFKDTMRSLVGQGRQMILPAVLFLVILSIQPLLYYFHTGNIFVWSYQGEGFNFFQPAIMDLLFSYRKGLFVYTPLVFLSMFGLFVLFRQDKFRAVAFLLFFIVNTYILASWHMWYYGGSFGMRPYIEFYPLFGILLGILIRHTFKPVRIFLLALLPFILFLNLIQSWQAYRMILPWDGMDKEKYWTIFLKTDRSYSGIFLPGQESPFDALNGTTKTFYNDFDPGATWFDMHTVASERAYSGTHASKLGGKNDKSVSLLRKAFECLPDSFGTAWVKIRFMGWLDSKNSSAYLVSSFEKDTGSLLWNGSRLREQITTARTWMPFEKTIEVPGAFRGKDVFQTYVLREDSTEVYIDDIEVTFTFK